MDTVFRGICLGALAVGTAWGDVAVDALETRDITVTNSVTLAEPVWFAEQGAKIEKDGAGDWTFPVSNVRSRHGATLAVREGRLTVTPGEEPPVMTEPTSILNRAAFWLDANRAESLVPGANDFYSGIARWYDVRETCANDQWGAQHYCAEAKASFITNEVEEGVWQKFVRYPVMTNYADRPDLSYVWFNGMKSGTWMRFLTTARADMASISLIRHVFVAGYATNAWGYVLGANSGSTIFWHPSDSNGGINTTYANVNSSQPAMHEGVSRLNGDVFVPESTTIKRGAYLYEWDAGSSYGYFGNFFNDRNIWSTQNGWRCGGDSIGELVVFTNRLSTVEREQVSEWLLRKWVKAPAPGTLAVKAAKDSEVVLDGVSALVSGAGTVVATKENAFLDYSQAAPFDGATRLAVSAQKIESPEPTLALSAGETLAVTRDNYDNLGVARSVDAAKADAGVTALTLGSAATVRVVELPETVKKLSVSGAGELILSAPRPQSAVTNYAGDVYATMPNADFEEWKESKDVYAFSTSGKTYYHWTLESNETTDYFMNLAYLQAHAIGHWAIDGGTRTKFRYADYPFQGNNVLVIKQGGVLSNQVTFPVDGDYELTFLTAGRMDNTADGYAGGWTKMSLTDVHNVTTEIGTAFGYIGTSTQHQRFMIRGVKAGTYTFRLNHAVGTGDAHTIYDDFKFRLVTDIPTDQIVYPPNADFERVDIGSWAARLTRSSVNTLADWTFTYGDSSIPDIFIVTRGMTNTRYREGSAGGGVQLAFFGNGGTATSAAFTLPAGSWKLRFKKAAFHCTEGTSWDWNGKHPNANSGIQASLVDVEAGTEASLGTTASSSIQHMQTYTLGTAVTLAEPRIVQLKLRESTATGGAVPVAFVDELELVRQDGNALVYGTTFSDASGWTLQRNVDGSEATTKCAVGVSDPCRSVASLVPQMPYGVDYGIGKQSLDICQCGSAHRTITFAQSGTYRLEFSSRGRQWYYADRTTLPSRSYAGNGARFYLVDANSVTNEIYRTPSLYASNFVFRAGLFNVPAAGTYTFGIQGLNGLPQPDGTHLKVGYTATDCELFIDQLSVAKVADDEGPDISDALTLDLAEGTKLRLDFTGTNQIDTLRLNGVSVAGWIDASHSSGLVTGTGCLFIRPKGTVFILR